MTTKNTPYLELNDGVSHKKKMGLCAVILRDLWSSVMHRRGKALEKIIYI